MVFIAKKIFFTFLFNSSLFFILILGIQNSANKVKVNFIVDETVELPTSFIIGISFISGSIIGNLLPLNFQNKNNNL